MSCLLRWIQLEGNLVGKQYLVIMKVRPFIYVDGIPTMRDSELWGLFDKMLRDETESEVFYDSRISNHIDFIKFMKSPKNMLYVV